MGRVGFPVTATVIAGGRSSAIPWTMLGIELVAVLATTGLLAAAVTTLGGSAFLALIYGLSPGLFLSASRLLAEAPANAFAALGMYLWIRAREPPRRRAAIVGAGSAFAAAALIRETTLLFPLGIALWTISAGDGRFLGEGDALRRDVTLVDSDPYGEGWMVKIKLSNASEAGGLLSADAYKSLIGK